MSSVDKQMRTTAIVLATVFSLWVLMFFAVHGIIVFAYLALHGLTTGIFCYAMYRVDKKAAQAATSES